VWYNIYSQEARVSKLPKRQVLSPRKFLEKSLKNLLTKSQKCGIIYTSRGEGINLKGWREWSAEARTAHYNKPPKIFEKLFKNLLTKTTFCGII
jgi:hypothetical protein